MDIASKVVDAFELAAHRLDEPPVRTAYLQLVSLVDQQLGGQIVFDDASRPLTEPQRVFIAYGLKHLRSSQAAPLERAAGRLIAALSGEEVDSQQDHSQAAVPLSQPVVQSTEVNVQSEHRTQTPNPIPTTQYPSAQPENRELKTPNSDPRPPIPEQAPPAPRSAINRVKQRLGIVTGGTVNMIGIQNHHHAASPSPPVTASPLMQDEPPLDDEQDTSEISAQPEDKPARQRHDVFLSYSRRNAEVMRRVRADLRAAGLNVWTDDNLQPGTPSWKVAIETAIQQSRSVVVIMSPDAKKSEWVERELNAAKTLNVPIFPILAKGESKNAVPFMLNGYQFVDIRKEDGYRAAMLKLTNAVKSTTRRTRE
ncbi:MAG: TIR domain-containing protein [Chloroflexota bacterium]|nr:TIR domain-containing protein [Chloroflexota bacterium]